MANAKSGVQDPAAAGGKVCNLLRVYLKDASFEAPGVPGVLFGHDQPGLEFDVRNTYSRSAEASAKLGEVFAVEVRVTMQARTETVPLFLVEVVQGGLFEVAGYDALERDYVLRTKAAAALYPYARELVGSLVNRAGFPRVYLAPVNFEAKFSEALQQAEAAAGSAA